MSQVRKYRHKGDGEIQAKCKQTTSDTQDILNLITSHTGHDFTQYKLNTISRRIERRSSTIQMEDLSLYYDYLIENNTSKEALFNNMTHLYMFLFKIIIFI